MCQHVLIYFWVQHVINAHGCKSPINAYILVIRDKQCRYIHANFPDSGRIFPILTILPDFPIGIFKILYFPDFLSLSPVLRQYIPQIFNLKFIIPHHFVTPDNQNRDKQSPLLAGLDDVYLMQCVETMWTNVMIWGHLTFVGAYNIP
jgi:hypothetical protein